MLIHAKLAAVTAVATLISSAYLEFVPPERTEPPAKETISGAQFNIVGGQSRPMGAALGDVVAQDASLKFAPAHGVTVKRAFYFSHGRPIKGGEVELGNVREGEVLQVMVELELTDEVNRDFPLLTSTIQYNDVRPGADEVGRALTMKYIERKIDGCELHSHFVLPSEDSSTVH